MKFEAKEILNSSRNIPKGVFLLPFTLLIVTMAVLPLMRSISQPSLDITEKRCNIFSGHWAPYLKEPYYNNKTCPYIIDQLDCFRNGRPDREFLKLRWKPHECELPLFNANQFLELVRGKSMAFIGDSMGRNQMESLICLVNRVANDIEDISDKYKSKYHMYSKWWFSANYNFSLRQLWSPFLVKAVEANPRGYSFDSAMNLYLDVADKEWANEIENLDIVIFSAGQWFFRPMTFYENGKVVGSQKGGKHMEGLNLYGYRKAFQTSLKTVLDHKGFKGMTFLVTHSPKHFENGDYNDGGTCNRTEPFTMEQRKSYSDGEILDAFHHIQLEEFRAAEKEARKKGLQFGLIDVTDAMSMRPDAHPDKYGHLYNKDVKVTDCVHWCLPGPVDTWNEVLLYMMKLERDKHTLV